MGELCDSLGRLTVGGDHQCKGSELEEPGQGGQCAWCRLRGDESNKQGQNQITWGSTTE